MRSSFRLALALSASPLRQDKEITISPGKSGVKLSVPSDAKVQTKATRLDRSEKTVDLCVAVPAAKTVADASRTSGPDQERIHRLTSATRSH